MPVMHSEGMTEKTLTCEINGLSVWRVALWVGLAWYSQIILMASMKGNHSGEQMYQLVINMVQENET